MAAPIEKETSINRSAFVVALRLIGGGTIGAALLSAPRQLATLARVAATPAIPAIPAIPGPAMPDKEALLEYMKTL